MRRALSITVVFGAVAGVVMACGSTAPLQESVVVPPDAAVDATVVFEPIDASTTTPIADATVEAGPFQCAGCVIGTCGPSIESCLGDKNCIGILTCVAETCLVTPADGGNGLPSINSGLDTSCLLGCFSNNVQGAVAVLNIFTCVTGTCGGNCGSVLGGLGNLGGLGGLGGFGKDPIDQSQIGPIDEAAFREVFTPIVQQSKLR